eukprot:6372452-Amphidinium_carterae.1
MRATIGGEGPGVLFPHLRGLRVPSVSYAPVPPPPPTTVEEDVARQEHLVREISARLRTDPWEGA